MRSRMKRPIILVVSTVLITSTFLNIGPTAFGQKVAQSALKDQQTQDVVSSSAQPIEGKPKIASVPLYPRAVFLKPAKTVIINPDDGKVVVLKFWEGTRVHLRNGQLTAELDN